MEQTFAAAQAGIGSRIPHEGSLVLPRPGVLLACISAACRSGTSKGSTASAGPQLLRALLARQVSAIFQAPSKTEAAKCRATLEATLGARAQATAWRDQPAYPCGGPFPDRARALRLIIAVAVRVTAIWDDRRCLNMTAAQGGAHDEAGTVRRGDQEFCCARILHRERDLTQETPRYGAYGWSLLITLCG
jgi:hypothetical protein